MNSAHQPDDTAAIRALVARQFASLSWSETTSGDWEAFAADFHPDATLWPAARPAQPQTVPAFVDRMKALAQTTLRTFDEKVLGTQVHVVGNVAVAIAAAEMTENGAHVNRNVEMLLLVKSDGAWRIVCQAWDRAGVGKLIPDNLVAGRRAD
jgi:ketosteroid isomerase-like protein